MSLKQKLEEAVIAVLKSTSRLESAMHYYRGQEPQTTIRELPCVTVTATGAREHPLNTGNYRYRLHIGVWDSADWDQITIRANPTLLHAAHVAAVTDAMSAPHRELQRLLTDAVPKFGCLGIVRTGQLEHDPDHRDLVDFFGFEIVCCDIRVT